MRLSLELEWEEEVVVLAVLEEEDAEDAKENEFDCGWACEDVGMEEEDEEEEDEDEMMLP